MANPIEPQAAHTEAGEGLTETERVRLHNAGLTDPDYMRPGTIGQEFQREVYATVEQIIRDRQADTLEAAATQILADCADFDSYSGKADDFCGYCERAAQSVRDRARTLRGER